MEALIAGVFQSTWSVEASFSLIQNLGAIPLQQMRVFESFPSLNGSLEFSFPISRLKLVLRTTDSYLSLY